MDFAPLQFDQVRGLFKYVHRSLNTGSPYRNAYNARRHPRFIPQSPTGRAFATIAVLNLPAFIWLRFIDFEARWRIASSHESWISSGTLTGQYAGKLLDATQLSESIISYRAKAAALAERNAFISNLALSQCSRYFTWLTSAFLHDESEHLLLNMVGLYTYAQACARIPSMGSFDVFAITIGGAISGSLALLTEWRVRNSPFGFAYGASSVLFSFLAVATLGRPNDIVQYGGPFKIPLWAVSAITAASQVRGLLEVDQGSARLFGGRTQRNFGMVKIGFAAHLGGAAFGALYYYFFLRRRRVGNFDAPGRVLPEEWTSSYRRPTALPHRTRGFGPSRGVRPATAASCSSEVIGESWHPLHGR